MGMGIFVGCVIGVVGIGLTVYGMLTGGKRDRAAVAALESALRQWAVAHGAGELHDVGDPASLVASWPQRRMDEVLLACHGHRRSGRFTVVAFLEHDEPANHHLLLIRLSVGGQLPAPSKPSGASRHGRRRWARETAAMLGYDDTATHMLEQAAAAVDGSLHLVRDQLCVLHCGLPRTAVRDLEPHPDALVSLLDSATDLAEQLSR
ncbi:hypothetical protein GCM10010400_38420 [Streptomyces aculeolatus]